jgi:plasmid maintenance system killer protein
VISRTTSGFRRSLARLPEDVKRQARNAYQLFRANPQHPSLRFKKLPPFADLWSVRINNDYRAVGRWRGDVIVWFFIGSHSEYDRLLAME